MGLAPGQALVGDLIVVLYGGTMCYILRRAEQSADQPDDASSHYHVIGGKFHLEAYHLF